MASLTDYEQRQVQQIAGWKAEPPFIMVELLDAATHPLVLFAKQFVPENAVRNAFEVAYQSSEILVHRDDILKCAGVSDIRDLRRANFEQCDRLADEFARKAGERAMLLGATISSGRGAGAVLGMEVIVTFALKTIHTIGFCYGCCPEDPREKDYALRILLAAAAGNMNEKQQAMADLKSVEEFMLGEVVERLTERSVDIAAEEAIEQVSQTAPADFLTERVLASGALRAIPLLGILVGAVSDAAVAEYIGHVAKHAFQERWLRANGKVQFVAPNRTFVRSPLARAESVVTASCYWCSFLVSFVVTYPPLLLLSFLPEGNAASQAFGDGRDAAARDCHRLTDAIRKWSTRPIRTTLAPAILPATG